MTHHTPINSWEYQFVAFSFLFFPSFSIWISPFPFSLFPFFSFLLFPFLFLPIRNVVQLMNQYCSPMVDINLSVFPKYFSFSSFFLSVFSLILSLPFLSFPFLSFPFLSFPFFLSFFGNRVDQKNPVMLKKVQSWDFDAFELSEDETYGAIMCIFDDLRIFNHFTLDIGIVFFLLIIPSSFPPKLIHFSIFNFQFFFFFSFFPLLLLPW